MIALYIFLAILLILILILLSNVSFFALLNDEISVYFRFWFLKFTILPKKVRKSTKKVNSQQNKKISIKKMIQEKGIIATVSELISVLDVFLKEIGKISSHLKVRRFNLKAVVASSDPAETGLLYGSLCGIIFPAFRTLQTQFKFNENKTRIVVDSDFSKEESEFNLSLKCNLRLVHLLIFGLSVLFELIRRKTESLKSNENN